jgi:hypothetical protein
MDLREALTKAEHLLTELQMLAKLAALLLTLFVSQALAQRAAAPTPGLEQCAGHLESCRAECRARIFAVDPRREVCLKECADTELTCTQTADPGAQLAPSSQSRPISMRRR